MANDFSAYLLLVSPLHFFFSVFQDKLKKSGMMFPSISRAAYTMLWKKKMYSTGFMTKSYDIPKLNNLKSSCDGFEFGLRKVVRALSPLMDLAP